MTLTTSPAITAAGASSPTTAGGRPATGSTAAGTGDPQDRFMSLLVAQIRNQDPLNPMDNAQMTSQIAQINTVAGIERLNKTVGDILTHLARLQPASAAPAAPAPAASSTASPDLSLPPHESTAP